MSNFSRFRLGDVLEIKHGFAFSGAGFVEDPGLPAVVTPGNFAIGGGFQERDKSFSGHVPPEYELAAGDLVLTMTDLSKKADTLGLPALVPSSNRIYLHNQRIGRVLITRPDLVDKIFLSYYLRTSSYRNHILATASGSTVRHTSPGRIEDFSADLPSLTTQIAIAGVLYSLDDKIIANMALTKTADSLVANIVRSYVTNGETIPLSDIAEVVMGSSPSGSSYNESGTGLAFYQGVRDFGERTPRLRVWTSEPVRFALPGDTLISVRAPVGRVNIAGERCCIGRGLAALRSTTARPASLFHLIQLVDWAPFEAEGTVFGSINQRQLNRIAIPSPDRSVELEARVAVLEALISSHLAENQQLARLRDTLLPALMSGQLRVKDAERQVEDAV